MASKHRFGSELLRYIVTGICCALLDYLFCELFLFICRNINEIGANIISTMVGFIVGVTLNYFMSTFWVFRDVTDKKKVERKTAWFVTRFILFAFVGLLISEGVMVLSQYIVNRFWGIEIASFTIGDIFTSNFLVNVTFWVYVLCFIIRTLIGMIWNYTSRKFILYKTDTKKVKITDSADEPNTADNK